MSLTVARRTREIGIRTAPGADPRLRIRLSAWWSRVSDAGRAGRASSRPASPWPWGWPAAAALVAVAVDHAVVGLLAASALVDQGLLIERARCLRTDAPAGG